MAGLAARRLPGARAPGAGAHRRRPRARGSSRSGITVVSTVPTLAALWPRGVARRRPAADLRRRGVPARARRAAGRRRAARCGTPTAPPRPPSSPARRGSTGAGPVRIGLPLDGWDLAVVDARRRSRSPMGETGELIIGGVGPGPLPRPGEGRREVRRRCRRSAGSAPTAAATWCAPSRRAWSSWAGPTTRSSSAAGASSSARSTPRCRRCPASPARRPPCARPRGGNQLLVGYLALRRARARPRQAARRLLRESLPAALVPRLAVVDDAPRRDLGQGRPRRAALAAAGAGRRRTSADPRARRHRRPWLAEQWTRRARRRAGQPATTTSSTYGGGSLAAAQLVSRAARPLPGGRRRRRLRSTRRWARSPTRLAELAARPSRRAARCAPTPAPGPGRRSCSRWCRCSPSSALRWLIVARASRQRAGAGRRVPWAPTVSWWWVAVGWLVFVSPPGRMALGRRLGPAAAARRTARARYPRGGGVHLRLWSAERLADGSAGRDLAGAPWMPCYARLLGAQVGPRRRPALAAAGHRPAHARRGLRRSSRRSTFAATGSTATCCTSAGSGSAPGATVGSRSTLLPGARIGQDAEIAAGLGGRRARCRPGSAGPGRPPSRLGGAAPPGRGAGRPRPALGGGCTACRRVVLGLLPLVAVAAGLAVAGSLRARTRATLGDGAARRAARACPSRRWSAWPCYALRHAGRACGSSASACARATTRCAAGSAGRSGRPSG